MSFSKKVLAALAGAVAAVPLSVTRAAPIAPGDLLVYRVGDGTSTITTAAAAVSILEYTPTGTLVQTINLPTTGTSSFTDTGSATADGVLQISDDGAYLLAAGYRADVGSSAPDAASATTVNRVFGRVSLTSGTADTSVAATVPNQVRGWASPDGTSKLYMSDSSGSPRYLAAPSGTGGNGTILTASVATRQVSVVKGVLYASITSSTPGSGIYSYGGLPTAATTPTQVVSLGADSAQGFFFADLDAATPGVDTLYVSDITANTINKYSLVGSAWVANGTVAAGGIANLTGSVTNGVVTLYGAQATKLSTLTDTAGYNAADNGTVTDLAGATPGTNFAFKGVAVAPVPEPASLSALALGGLLLGRRRRRSS